jgi:hypothetical protein
MNYSKFLSVAMPTPFGEIFVLPVSISVVSKPSFNMIIQPMREINSL